MLVSKGVPVVVFMAVILLVDSDREERKKLCNALNRSFITIDAEDGEAGLISTRLINPDLIITNLHLNKISGLELVRRIKKIKPQIKIIVLSACFHSIEQTNILINAGATRCLVTPISFENLINVISELLMTSDNQSADNTPLSDQ